MVRTRTENRTECAPSYCPHMGTRRKEENRQTTLDMEKDDTNRFEGERAQIMDGSSGSSSSQPDSPEGETETKK